MRYLYALLLCLILPVSLLAQPNWQVAEITLTDGAERRGEIDDRRWSYHFDDFRFRISAKQGLSRIPLSSVQRFTVNGRRYEVAEVNINTSSRDTRQLLRQEHRSVQTLRVPLLVLVEGPMSLFEYDDERGNAHFFLRENGQPLEYLDYGRYELDSEDGRTLYNEVNAFRSQLITALAGCLRIQQDILTARYRRETLLDIFEKYYNCGRARSGYWFTPEKGVWQLGPDLGMVKSNPTYGEIEEVVYPFRRLNSWEPAYGLHAKYRFAGPHGSVGVRLGAWYHSFNVSASVPDPEEEDPAAEATFNYSYNERSLHFQLGPEIVILRTRYPVFLETMVEYHRILNYQESRFLTRTIGGQTTAEGIFHDFSRQGAFSLTTGAGIVAGKARVSLRLSATRRKYDTYVLNLYRMGFVGSYDF